jgi:hypothetical protein
MKQHPRSPRNPPALALLGILIAGLLPPGCSIDKHTVIASTGTNLGIDVAADPSTQTPRIKIGYNRGELALVPSNRSANKEPGSRYIAPRCEKCVKGEDGCKTPDRCALVLSELPEAVLKNTRDGGAVDTAEVLMEIRMQGGILFSGVQDAGLYQRLAVGKTAVRQPGASLMFARDNKGNLSSEGAVAVARATAAVKGIPEEPGDTLATRAGLARAYLAADDKTPFDEAAREAGYAAGTAAPFQQFLLDEDFKSDNAGKRAAATARLKVLTEALKARGISVE